MRVVDTRRLRDVLVDRFPDLVAGVSLPGTNRLRVLVRDGSIVDVWFSLWLEDRYSYRWERRAIDGTLYRCDNAPHKRWASVKTFPHHFHCAGSAHRAARPMFHARQRVAVSVPNLLGKAVGAP